MKKFLACVCAVAMLAACSFTFTAFAEDPAPKPRNISISKGTVGRIDGKIDGEWDKAEWSDISGRLDPAAVSDDPADIKKVWDVQEAKLKLLWDEKNLYLAVSVKDDELGTFNSGVSNAWAHDGITVYMRDGGTELNKEQLSAWSNGKSVEEMNEMKIDSMFYDIFGNLGGNIMDETYGRPVRAAVTVDSASNSYVMEMRIPFRTDKKAGDDVRFALTVQDYEDSAGNRVAFRSWNSSWYADYYSTAEWAYLILDEKAAPTPPTTEAPPVTQPTTQETAPSEAQPSESAAPVPTESDAPVTVKSTQPSIQPSTGASTTAPGETDDDSPLIWIVLAIVVLAVAGGGIGVYFIIKKKKA